MINLKNLSDLKLAIIGLGYVGLPLAVEFGKRRAVVGFDINQQRIDQLKTGYDATLETEPEELITAKQLSFSNNPDHLKDCSCFIVGFINSSFYRRSPLIVRFIICIKLI